MTFAPCLEHQPMHSFSRGWVCAICGAAVTPKPLVTAEWVTQKSALEGGSDPTTGLPMTQDYAALVVERKSIDPKGTPNLARKWMDRAADAIATLQRERDEMLDELTRRNMEIMGRGEALTIAEAEAATLRARLEAVEGALREAREFIAETKNNPRDDGKIVEIIGRIDAALQEPQT